MVCDTFSVYVQLNKDLKKNSWESPNLTFGDDDGVESDEQSELFY